MSKNLNDIRKEIDLIDNQVHDLFMRRATLVSSVAAAKAAAGLQIVHPAREAMLMRRLLDRHSGVLPRSTIIRIWRELIGSVSLMQTGLSVVVSSASYWDMAKNYFGSEIPMSNVSSTQNALKEVRENDVYFAVMPWFETGKDSPWWSSLASKNNDLSVVCALPYVDKDKKALVVSKIDFMSSGNDISFIGVSLSSNISHDIIAKNAKDAGFDVINISSNNAGDMYILEVNGFVGSAADEMLALHKYLDGNFLYCGVIGGYPVITI